MYNNKNDDFQQKYNADIMADDTDEIELFEEDDDIGNISDFEDEEEARPKSKFSFGGNKVAGGEKKPLDKKNLLVILIALGLLLMLGLLAVPGIIRRSTEKKQAENAQNSTTEQPVYTGDAEQTNGTGNLAVGGEQMQNEMININEPCDTVNPNNPSNINNPNCANMLANQGQNQNAPVITGQQAPVYSSPIIQEIPEPYRPEPYQPRNIQKPSSGSLNSLSGGNSSSNGRSNMQTSNNGNNGSNNSNNTGNTLNGQQTTSNNTGGMSQDQRTRPRYQPKADGINTFSLQQGSYIPIAITTQMNSDNPSYFMAIVSENVYSKDGKHKVLIPMGSKLIGNYMALKNNNDTRVFMIVEKIILPNNKVIMFDNANIVDLRGEIGARGKLNTKFLQRLGKTLLAVSFSVADLVLDYRKAKTIAENSDRVSQATWEDLINDPVGSARDTMDVIDKSWNSVKNRIKIPIGTRLNVLTGNEIVLEEYRVRVYQ